MFSYINYNLCLDALGKGLYIQTSKVRVGKNFPSIAISLRPAQQPFLMFLLYGFFSPFLKIPEELVFSCPQGRGG